jgi:hypothetical protein
LAVNLAFFVSTESFSLAARPANGWRKIKGIRKA